MSKSALINSSTAIILGIWLVILFASIHPIEIGADASKRDLIEAALEVGEKSLAFAAVTAKTYWWRLTTFAFVAAFAVVKEAVEVHFDPAPERVAGVNRAFAGALTAKALEHIAYAVRLTPASKAWDSGIHESKYISPEQWVRRSLWAGYYYQNYLLMQHKRRLEIEMQPEV